MKTFDIISPEIEYNTLINGEKRFVVLRETSPKDVSVGDRIHIHEVNGKTYTDRRFKAVITHTETINGKLYCSFKEIGT